MIVSRRVASTKGKENERFRGEFAARLLGWWDPTVVNLMSGNLILYDGESTCRGKCSQFHLGETFFRQRSNGSLFVARLWLTEIMICMHAMAMELLKGAKGKECRKKSALSFARLRTWHLPCAR